MSKKVSQAGFVPLVALILIAVIGAASALVIKNAPLQNFQPTPEKGFQGNSSAQLKPKTSPTPTITNNTKTSNKSTTPTATPKPSSTSTSNSSTNNSSSSNNSSNNNNNSTPTPAPSTSSTGTLKGTVKNSSGSPLANASFQISCDGCNKLRNGISQDEQADGSGNFTVNNLPALTLTVKAFYAHWGEAKNVTITSGQTTNVDLVVGADTTPKPTISITKGPYSSGVQAPCFDVQAYHQNCYQLSAEYTFDNGSTRGDSLSSAGACYYTGTICGIDLGGPHTFKVKAKTVGSDTYSDEVSSTYTYP